MAKEASSASLSVMLIVADASAAVGWYSRALGAEVIWDLDGVAGLRLNGAPFFIHEAVTGRETEPSPTAINATTTRIEVFVDDPAALIEQAQRGGASDVQRPSNHRMPWGDHWQGAFTDPFGHRWSVGDRSPLEPHR